MENSKRTTDQLISASDVREIVQHLSAQGWQQKLEDVEHQEPCLATYVTTASETLEMSLRRVGYDNRQLSQSKLYFLHALIVVHVLTRNAHRRLLDEFLPETPDAATSDAGDGKDKPIDACVSNEDGIRWMQEIIDNEPQELALQLAEAEPAVVGVAIRIADRARVRLLKMGATPEIADAAASNALLSGVVAAELMRRGHGKLWDDVWQSNTGDSNGK